MFNLVNFYPLKSFILIQGDFRMVNLSQVKNFANLTSKYVKFAQRPSILQTKPIDFNISGLKYTPITARVKEDTFACSKKLIAADDSLFDWASKKADFSFSNMNPNSVALVHMTNYFPKNGQILSTNLATKAANGIGNVRSTIHFCLNKPVVEHQMGNSWNTMDYAVILPFNETLKQTPKSKVLGGMNEDFFFQDMVKIPKGSVIVKYNSKVPNGKFLSSEAFDGIPLIETSNRNVSESANTIIKKMGFTTYNDALKKHLHATDEEIKIITATPESEFTAIKDAKKYKKSLEKALALQTEAYGNDPELAYLIENTKSALKRAEILERYSEKLKHIGDSCKKYCEKENLFDGLHTQSPWFRSEVTFGAIDSAEVLNHNSWGKTLKNKFIEFLKTAKTELPEGKNLGYDVDKAISIIEKSETPQMAKENLAKELKLKSMNIMKMQIPKEELSFSGEELEDIIKLTLESIFLK